MATQWPRVVDRLLAWLPTLPGWSVVSVFDGMPVVSTFPTDYATVGYVAGDDTAGSYQTVLHLDGVQLAETGQVRTQLTCAAGDPDMGAVRGRVFALTDAVEVGVRADRRLGATLSPEGTVEFTVDVLSLQNTQGAAQSLVFTLTYFTVT